VFSEVEEFCWTELEKFWWKTAKFLMLLLLLLLLLVTPVVAGAVLLLHTKSDPAMPESKNAKCARFA
jgi:hypothetical protein